MSKILIDISAKKIWQKEEINLVRKVLLSCYASLSLKEYLELSVRLTDDKEIMDLNKKYRNKNSPTNVLSFCSQKCAKYLVKSQKKGFYEKIIFFQKNFLCILIFVCDVFFNVL